jgi:hypothetical protein
MYRVIGADRIRCVVARESSGRGSVSHGARRLLQLVGCRSLATTQARLPPPGTTRCRQTEPATLRGQSGGASDLSSLATFGDSESSAGLIGFAATFRALRGVLGAHRASLGGGRRPMRPDRSTRWRFRDSRGTSASRHDARMGPGSAGSSWRALGCRDPLRGTGLFHEFDDLFAAQRKPSVAARMSRRPSGRAVGQVFECLRVHCPGGGGAAA